MTRKLSCEFFLRFVISHALFFPSSSYLREEEHPFSSSRSFFCSSRGTTTSTTVGEQGASALYLGDYPPPSSWGRSHCPTKRKHSPPSSRVPSTWSRVRQNTSSIGGVYLFPPSAGATRIVEHPVPSGNKADLLAFTQKRIGRYVCEFTQVRWRSRRRESVGTRTCAILFCVNARRESVKSIRFLCGRFLALLFHESARGLKLYAHLVVSRNKGVGPPCCFSQ